MIAAPNKDLSAKYNLENQYPLSPNRLISLYTETTYLTMINICYYIQCYISIHLQTINFLQTRSIHARVEISLARNSVFLRTRDRKRRLIGN